MPHEERLTSVKPTTFSGDREVVTTSSSLDGIRVALCVGGGIAATETPRIARALRRLGAEVEAYMTANARKFIGEASLEWATAKPVTGEPTGNAEHVTTHDMIFVACATADLIGKAAHGICSDGVTTLIQSALGAGVPLVLAPTMHESLSLSPVVRKNLDTLLHYENVFSITPRREEDKLKSRFADEIADELSHRLHRFLAKRESGAAQKGRALVTAGGTRVPLDSVRAISNLSTGALGRQLVGELYRWGFEVELGLAEASVDFPKYDGLTVHHVKELRQMQSFLESSDTSGHDGLFMLAAISDFEPSNTPQEGKISSGKESLTLELKRTQKLIDAETLKSIPFRMACKLTTDSGPDAKEALKKLQLESDAHLIFWNTLSEAFGSQALKGHLWQTHRPLGEALPCTSKQAVAQAIVELFREHLGNQTRGD